MTNNFHRKQAMNKMEFFLRSWRWRFGTDACKGINTIILFILFFSAVKLYNYTTVQLYVATAFDDLTKLQDIFGHSFNRDFGFNKNKNRSFLAAVLFLFTADIMVIYGVWKLNSINTTIPYLDKKLRRNNTFNNLLSPLNLCSKLVS